MSGFRQKFPDKKLFVIFQPHLFSRTKMFLDDFASSFVDADEVVVLPIYAAREIQDSEISSKMLVERMQSRGVNVVHKDTFVDAARYIEMHANKDSVVMTVGAGDVHLMHNILCE